MLLGGFLGWHRCWRERRGPTLGKRNVALIIEERNLAAFVLDPRHHASAGKCGVADRVCVEIGVGSTKLDIYDDKIGDVLHVFANALFGQALGSSVADQDVASDATRNLVMDMA